MSADKNILIVTYWPYNSGILNSYALPYVRIIRKVIPVGSKIFLFTLSPAKNTNKADFKSVERALAAEGIQLVNFNYHRFGLRMLIKFAYIFLHLMALVYRHRIKYIHAWCTPGGAIGYILTRLTRARLVLDSFEPHAEAMVEVGAWKKTGLAYRLLFKLEKLQLAAAKRIICAAEGMMDHAKQCYGVERKDYFVKPACVDLDLFRRRNKDLSLTPDIKGDSIVCTYVGKFGDIYLTGEVFDFFKVAHDFWGDRFKVLLLTNHSDEEIHGYCLSAGLKRSVISKHYVNHNNVPKYLSIADFAICPVRPVPSKRYCTPIKNGEYWAMRLPVVITKNISTDSDLIEKNNIGYVLRELNHAEYLEAVKRIQIQLEDKSIGDRIWRIAEIHRNYSIAEAIYKAIYA